jgi:hypothetical protein
MDRRIMLTLPVGALLFVSGGCSRPTLAEFPQWSKTPVVTDAESGTAYAGYCEAGRNAEKAAEKYLYRVIFTPGQKRAAAAALEPALDQLASATRRPTVGFRFIPTGDDQPTLYFRGWRMLGDALVWRIEQNVEARRDSAAIRDLITATRFGFDLGNASTLEGSLGLTIIDDARRAFLPALARLDSAELTALSSSMKLALQRRPDVSITLENERLVMLRMVQRVQDAYQQNKLDDLTKEVGPEIDRAADYLSGLRRDGDKGREQYFEGFAKEAETVADRWQKLAKLSAQERDASEAKRLAREKKEPDQSRPWKRFAKHFFSAGMPYLEQRDTTLARTRLLALEAGLTLEARRRGFAPADLKGFGPMADDPFSGGSFAYRRTGREFKVYSVGPNFRDDGGQSDESYSVPDVMLETRG